MQAIILAGGRCKPDLKEISGCEWRGDLTIDGRTMLDVAADALRPFGGLIVVGPRPLPDALHSEPGSSFPGSLQKGLELVTDEEVIIATSDMPWLTKESVKGFLARRPDGCDLAYPILLAQDCLDRYPGLPRTSVALREGKYTGGNLIWAKTKAVKILAPWMERAYEARKSPLALGRMIGWDLLSRMAIGKVSPQTLSIGYLERRVSHTLGIEVKAVSCPFPEIGTDIDSAEQYEVMLSLQNSVK